MTDSPIQAVPAGTTITGAEGCCASCGSPSLTDVFEVKSLPVHVGLFYDTREAALRAPVGEIKLAFCHACGLVRNRGFDAAQTSFQPGYEVGLQHSQVFRKFLKGVAKRLIEQYGLQHKTIFEIGCGSGYFLRVMCEMGENQGIGVDPTVEQETVETLGNGSARFIRDFYTDRFLEFESDFVCCLSVFEDIPDPAGFLARVRRMIGTRRDVPVYFEVFNALGAFERQETWSVHYEQCNYFSLQSITDLFRRCGFDVQQAGTCYEGDQYLYVEAAARDADEVCPAAGRPAAILPPVIANFQQHFLATREHWRSRLNEFQQTGQRVVLWGSGGKGISFLNSLETQGAIEYVVEINPGKHGKFIPGTGQEIVPPKFLADYQPDKVIITNSLYEREMKQQAAELGVQAEFLVA